MSVAARIYVDPVCVRAARRTAVALDATVRGIRAAPHDAVVRNLSSTGCLLETDQALAPGTPLAIGISGIGVVQSVVARIAPDGIGCTFSTPLSARLIEATGRREPPAVIAPAAFASPAGGTSMPAADRPSRRRRLGLLVGLATIAWAVPAAIYAGALPYLS